MNYIKHLTGFFNCIANEEIIYPTHISLYLALFQSWNINRFKNPITISREEMMKASRIASKATYHKCIKELSEIEAERFFNYYTSNGWLIGGKTKMKDWNAAARNWMLTTSKFSINFPSTKKETRLIIYRPMKTKTMQNHCKIINYEFTIQLSGNSSLVGTERQTGLSFSLQKTLKKWKPDWINPMCSKTSI